MHNTCLLLAFAIIHHSLEYKLIETHQEQQIEFSEQFINVVRLNFAGVRTLVFLYEAAEDDHIIDDLIGEHPFYSVELSAEGVTKFNGIYNYVYDDFITFEESKLYLYKVSEHSDYVEAINTVARIYFWRTRDKILVIINDRVNHAGIVNAFTALQMLNVIFIYGNGSVFTFDKLVKKDFFEINDSNYFYNKMSDFRRNGIKISMFKHVRDAIPRKFAPDYDGRDGLLARTFMDFINATGIYIEPSDGIEYGENKGNRNITGVFGDVARNRTDVALNSRFMKNEFENVVEYTYPHDRDDLIVLVPCGSADMKFEYGKSFQSIVWLSIAVFNFSFFVVFIKSDTFDTKLKALFYTFGMFFGQAYEKARTKLGRYLLFLYTLYSFLIVIHYSSLLMSIITVPHKPKEIDSFEDLADSKLKMYTVERYKRYLILYGEESVRRLKDRIFIASEMEVRELIDAHGDYAVICKRSVADWAVLHRNNYKGGKMVHRIMKKSPFPAIVCYIVKYGSPLKLRLNRYMESIIESGIQVYWISSTLTKIFIEENAYYHLLWNPEKKIELDQISTLFLMYVIGIVISIVAFLSEIVYNRKNSHLM